MLRIVVVLEVRDSGERLVWDFSSRQALILKTSVGRVGDWLRVNREDASVTDALLTTSDVEIKPLVGRHVMVRGNRTVLLIIERKFQIKTPAMKLPDFEKDFGISTDYDRTKRFVSPFLGPIDAFFGTDQFPENVLVELETIKCVS